MNKDIYVLAKSTNIKAQKFYTKIIFTSTLISGTVLIKIKVFKFSN